MTESPASRASGVVVTTGSESDTERAGEELGRTLEPGSVLLLYGQLGAGKTAFVRGLARGLGAPVEDVSSPTFTIMQEYAGARGPVYHVDLYRLTAAEIDDLGLDELTSGSGVVAIEWADRWPGRPHDAIDVELQLEDESHRRITVRR